MSNLTHAESFRELIVYQKAREVQREIFTITKDFPKDEKFSLSDQIRRSSRSIGANIAEAWAKRRYEAHFVSKLTDADGEQYETQHWIDTAVECRYLEQQKGVQLIDKCQQVGRLLNGMITKANLFCGSPTKIIREDDLEYLINSSSKTD